MSAHVAELEEAFTRSLRALELIHTLRHRMTQEMGTTPPASRALIRDELDQIIAAFRGYA